MEIRHNKNNDWKRELIMIGHQDLIPFFKGVLADLNSREPLECISEETKQSNKLPCPECGSTDTFHCAVHGMETCRKCGYDGYDPNSESHKSYCNCIVEPLQNGEETRPTGEEEWEKGFGYRKLAERTPDYITHNGNIISVGWLIDFIREQLSLAREEGRKEQAELDRKIYGMSFEEFNKNYKEVDSLSNQSKDEK